MGSASAHAGPAGILSPLVTIPLRTRQSPSLRKVPLPPAPAGAQRLLALGDEVEWILSRLDSFGKRVMELRLQGVQLSEIAEDTGRSERSVRRTLGHIRELMGKRLDDA